MSNALSEVRRVSYVCTSTFGLICATRSFATSIFLRPTSLVPYNTWRCRFVSSMTSKSTIPRRPTPAAPRYCVSGTPRPPAPMISADDCLSLNCPAIPTSGRIRWREYRLISAGVRMSLRLDLDGIVVVGVLTQGRWNDDSDGCHRGTGSMTVLYLRFVPPAPPIQILGRETITPGAPAPLG